MNIRDFVTAAVLWVSVLAWSIWVGGTIYQMLVVVPMWSARLPESLEAFLKNTNYVRDIFRFFGPRWMPARSLALLLPFVGWNLRAHRPFFAVAACCFAAVILLRLRMCTPSTRFCSLRLWPSEMQMRSVHWLTIGSLPIGFGCLSVQSGTLLCCGR